MDLSTIYRLSLLTALLGAACAGPDVELQPRSVDTPAPSEPATPAAVPASTSFDVPTKIRDEAGRVEYAEARLYAPADVAMLAPGNRTPEAAVAHYIASRMRGDDRYREVVAGLDANPGAIPEAIGEHDRWTFEEFQLVGRRDDGVSATSITVQLTTTSGDAAASNTWDFAVAEIEARWYIVGVPY